MGERAGGALVVIDCNHVTDEMVRRHRMLAMREANRFRRFHDIADLESVALIGLAKAAARFDPSRGLEFSTYAMPTIRRTLLNYLRDHAQMVRIPACRQERGDYTPVPVVSLDALTREPVEWPDPVDVIAVRVAVERLPKRYQEVIRLRFVDGRTLREIGKRMGVTGACVARWMRDALEMLREELAG